MTFLEIRNVSKRYGGRYALKNINLSIEKGEILSIAGPPGSGKTTLLKIVAGLVRPDEGSIVLEGRDITDTPPHLRGISMVFEIPPVYPDRTGYDNIAFPLRLKGLSENEIKRRVYEVAELLGIKHILHRKPETFSGGEYQRVALARALVTNPTLLLLDEPLKSLDAKIREQMSIWLKELQRKIGVTAIYTTHDPLEAFTVGTRTAILIGGEIKQIGDPLDILEKPSMLEVDEYVSIPALNILTGRVEVEDDKLKVIINNVFLEKIIDKTLLERIESGKEHIIAIRPSDIKVSTSPSPHSFQGRVLLIQYLGSRTLASIEVNGTTIRAILPRGLQVGEGDIVYVELDVNRMRIYDPNSKMRIA